MTKLQTDYDPGVYQISEREYFAIDAASRSFLWKMRKSPAHAYQTIIEPEEKRCFNIGSAIHTAALEPQKFDKRFSVRPVGINRRTNAGKAEYAQWQDDNADKVLLEDINDFDRIKAVSAAVSNHPLLGPITTGPGKTELTVVWIDEETGVKCKCRIDRLVPWPHGGTCVFDLKSIADAADRKIEYNIRDFGYHFQGAFYLEGAKSAWGDVSRSFAMGFIEKDPPHGIKVAELDVAYLEAGRAYITPLLNLYKKCKESGEWPNYDDKLRVLEAPDWMVKNV